MKKNYPLLVRKINKAKWKKDEDGDVMADAITHCLKTTKNTLSVWEIQSEEELNNAVLALVSNADHPDTIDIVLLDEAYLINEKLKIEKTPGITKVESLKDTHKDIIELTYSKLGIVKNIISEKVDNNSDIRFTKRQLIKILKDAIKDGIIKKEDLKEGMQKKVID